MLPKMPEDHIFVYVKLDGSRSPRCTLSINTDDICQFRHVSHLTIVATTTCLTVLLNAQLLGIA